MLPDICTDQLCSTPVLWTYLVADLRNIYLNCIDVSLSCHFVERMSECQVIWESFNVKKNKVSVAEYWHPAYSFLYKCGIHLSPVAPGKCFFSMAQECLIKKV